MKINDVLLEFAPGGGGGSGDYLRALASAWYNETFNTGSLQKGIKSQEDVERLLARGIVAPDGKTRKYNIDYSPDFDGVVIFSDDYYEHSEHIDDGSTMDSRTGQKWGPNDYMEFSGEELDESVDEGAMATLGDDPWGPPGNFAGDKKIDVGPVSMRRIRVGDTVKYFGEKAQVVQINPATDYARISAGGKTLNVRLSDLKQLGQGLAEMDKSSPQPGRDGKVSHKTYGSRDNYKLGDPERTGKQISVKKANKDALDILKKQGVAEETFGPAATAAIQQGKSPSMVAYADSQDKLNIGKELKVRQQIEKGEDPTISSAANALRNAGGVAEGTDEKDPNKKKPKKSGLDLSTLRTAAKTAKPASELPKKQEQGVSEAVGSEEQIAEQTLQKLVNFARDNPETTMAQLASSPLKNRVTAALSACDTLIRSYTNAKQLGNAEFVRQLKHEINYFLTEKPPASSDPLDFGDLLTGKLGKINLQQGVAEDRKDYCDACDRVITKRPHICPGTEGSLNEFAPGNGDDGNGGPDNDFVYISKDKVADFEDWMESEGFDTDVPKTVKGRFVVYDYSGHDTMTIGYAKDWDEYESGLEEGKPQEKEADYGADYQDMVARVKKLAGLGPLKTVYDPQKRVYRNVPRAEQPKK